MRTLERHCQLLLRAYPAAYREMRGEEIIGTLLETTPPDRSWPRPRDVRGLLFGGLRARAALNRRFTTTANLRIALLAGVAANLAYSAAATVAVYVMAEIGVDGYTRPAPFGWPILLASALILLAVALVWLTGRRALVLAAALPAAAVVCYARWVPGSELYNVAFHLALLATLVALVALPGGRRPSRRSLVGVGILVALPALSAFGAASGAILSAALLLTLGAVSIAWAVIDARPAIAVLVFLAVLYLPMAVNELLLGTMPVFVLPYLGVLTVIAVPALWLLRRQSAHRGGRPAQIP